MDNNENQQDEKLTKKQKAEAAGKDVAEVAVRGAGKYFGGALGSAAVNAALNTKAGQKIVGTAGKVISKNPVTKNILASNQNNIRRVKPIANSLVGGTDEKDSSSKDDKKDINSDNEKDNSKDNNKDKKSFIDIFNFGEGKLSLKTKLILIGVCAAFIFVVIFIIVLITPLMQLGIINIEGISSGGYSSSMGPTYSSSSTTYWWPVGSSSTEEKDGVLYASGDPYSTNVVTNFDITNHSGVDISSKGASAGVVNVVAAKDGEVVYPTSQSDIQYSDDGNDNDGDGYGNYVKVKHSDGSYTLYAHLARNSITVMSGDVVTQGQVIGKIGSSGNATDTYLHFEVRVGSDSISNVVDPLKYLDASNPRSSSSSTSDAFSVTTTVLSRQEFINRMNDYCTRSGKKHFCNNFASNAGLVYDASVKNGVNPELVVVTAGAEQGWKNPCGGTNNYWGIGVGNTSGGCGARYNSLEDGIAGYAKVMHSYNTKKASMINSRYEQRKKANCDPAGHGPAGTVIGMQSLYSSIGAY